MIQTSGTAQSDNKIQGGSTHHNNQVLINDGFTWMYCYTGYTYLYIYVCLLNLDTNNLTW